MDKIHFTSKDFEFDLLVPKWFLKNRGTRGIIFEKYSRDNTPEVDSYNKIRKYMEQFSKDSIFLDIGANIGIISIPLAKKGYRVISVEPIPKNLEFLYKNVKINNVKENIHVIESAALDYNGTTDIFIPEEEDCTSIAENSAKVGGEILKKISVSTIKMDEWIQNNTNQNLIRLIKIDVQGFEYQVLKGLEKTLSLPAEQHVLLEWNIDLIQNAGNDPKKVMDFMTFKGFRNMSWGSEDILFVKESNEG